MSLHGSLFMSGTPEVDQLEESGKPIIHLGNISIHTDPRADASEQWRNLADAAFECYRIAERNRIGTPAPTPILLAQTPMAPPRAGDRVRHRTSLRQGYIESATRHHITVAYDSIGMQSVAPNVFDHHFERLGAQEAMAL